MVRVLDVISFGRARVLLSRRAAAQFVDFAAAPHTKCFTTCIQFEAIEKLIPHYMNVED